MGKPDIIVTPSGDRMAVIPLADYERLVAAAEDAADVRAYDAVKRRLATGEEELVPAEFANRILDGENPIRVWREFRRMTAAALAKKAGIARPYLTQMETRRRVGTIETMRSIADALGVTIDDLI
ncbi:MAG: helix-turn-helix transcriptional regulator [Bauldia sp.]